MTDDSTTQEQQKNDVFRGVAPEGGCLYCGRGQCCNCNWNGDDPTGRVKVRPELAMHYACEECYSAAMNI